MVNRGYRSTIKTIFLCKERSISLFDKKNIILFAKHYLSIIKCSEIFKSFMSVCNKKHYENVFT